MQFLNEPQLSQLVSIIKLKTSQIPTATIANIFESSQTFNQHLYVHIYAHFFTF